jgi:hypothetical protein
VTMDTIVSLMERVETANEEEIFRLSVAAAVGVRGNINHVSTATVRALYPELIIEGDRATGDSLNFSALRMIGFGFAALSSSPIAAKVSNKAGNCITGGTFPNTTAGKINKEAYESWTTADKNMFLENKVSTAWVDTAFAAIAPSSAKFATSMKA